MANLLKRFTLFLLLFALLTLGSQTIGTKQLTPDAHAACTMTYDFSMTSQDGQYVLVFFKDSRTTSLPPGANAAGLTYINKIPNAQIIINPDVSTAHAIAKISKTGSFTFSFTQNVYQNGTLTSDGGPCGNQTATPIPYDSSKDPFPKDKYYQVVLDTSTNKYKCQETTSPTKYTILSECELAAKGTPPISLPGGGGTIGNGGNVSKGDNPCQNGVCDTALGKLPTKPDEFATKILGLATGLGGAFAFILMVAGSIKVLTSSGDPKSVGAGRDMIVAAVAGLLFIIFSVVILRFIGMDILGLG